MYLYYYEIEIFANFFSLLFIIIIRAIIIEWFYDKGQNFSVFIR